MLTTTPLSRLATRRWHGGAAASLHFLLPLLLFSTAKFVEGHGHMTSPRSRNWVAKEDGVDYATSPGIPHSEYCTHCLNTNNGVCGKTDLHDYDEWLDALGTQKMPWHSQNNFIEEQVITVASYLDTHHNGHMEIRACPNGNDSTQECFDTPGHELTFVEDVLYGMPADVNHPERGMYAGGQGGGLKSFEMLFKLPKGIYGDEVMLQWKYITANSCSPPGYAEYFAANPGLPASYWTPGLGLCTTPYPNDGTRGTTWPEQFFNCAEVSIASAGPTPPVAPTTPAPVAMASPTKAPTQPSAPACCTQKFDSCVTWHGTTQAECEAASTFGTDVFWAVPNQPAGCTARFAACTTNPNSCCNGLTCVGDQYHAQCEYVAPNPTPPTPAPINPPTDGGPQLQPTPSPTPIPPAPTPSGTSTGCCSIDFKTCHHDVGSYCWQSEANCVGPCGKYWLPQGEITGCTAQWESCSSGEECCGPATCDSDGVCRSDGWGTGDPVTEPTNPPVPTAPVPTAPVPTVPVPTVPVPTAPAPPTTPPSPTLPTSLFSCSPGAGVTSWDALVAMEAITYQVSTTPYVLSVVSSGGAAGDGSSTVSESQAYGVLTAALALTSMNEGDANYEEIKQKFEGYFNGWRKMCRNSSGLAYCQSPVYCDGGTMPCLPGWKHSADFSNVEGTGAAPDGDEDAIVGMIIALKAVESDSVKPSWYDEVHDWADRSCTQFLADNTVLSSTGNHRLLKLGSCWGGWDSNGNNPSYHAPGHYRMMRDFQASISSRSYTLPQYVNSASWNMLIDTSYKFLATTQCPDTGLVPNWALVKEVDSQTLAKETGSFSGSGTPQYEFGSEASRTMWRIAFDAAAYPEESAAQSGAFLAPLQDKLVANFNPNPGNNWEYFGANSLQACSPTVSNVFGAWQWNYFISAPVYSTLVAGIAADNFVGTDFSQQQMVDAACGRVSDTANQSYYPLSWQVIAQMTLNGDVARAGELLAQPTGPTPAPVPTPSPTTAAPTPKPTQKPTPNPTSAPTPNPTAPPPGCFSNNYKDCNIGVFQAQENHSCTTIWLPTGKQNNCIALWGECTGQMDGCCEPAVCQEGSGGGYSQCVPPQAEAARRKLLRTRLN